MRKTIYLPLLYRNMYCSQCGATMDNAAKFCPSCGTVASADVQDLVGGTKAPPTDNDLFTTVEVEKQREVVQPSSNVASNIMDAMNVLLKSFPNKTADVNGTNSIYIDSGLFARSEIQFIFDKNQTSFNVKTNYLSIRGVRWVNAIIFTMFIWVWPVSIPLIVYDFIQDGKFNKNLKEKLSAEGYMPLN